MRFHVLTLFPDMVETVMHTSITGRAMERGYISLETVNIREYAPPARKGRVDDYPYGGGAGLVMQAEPVYGAWKSVIDREPKARTILLTPQGKPFDQKTARSLAAEEALIFVCGHYEGIDERVSEEIVTDYISLGDYVLTGGELAAIVVMDAVSRMVPGVLQNAMSAVDESFTEGLLEYPQYTRPEVWHDKEVPPILLSGHHANVDVWRREKSIERTLRFRPDLLETAQLSKKDREYLEQLLAKQEKTC